MPVAPRTRLFGGLAVGAVLAGAIVWGVSTAIAQPEPVSYRVQVQNNLGGTWSTTEGGGQIATPAGTGEATVTSTGFVKVTASGTYTQGVSCRILTADGQLLIEDRGEVTTSQSEGLPTFKAECAYQP